MKCVGRFAPLCGLVFRFNLVEISSIVVDASIVLPDVAYYLMEEYRRRLTTIVAFGSSWSNSDCESVPRSVSFMIPLSFNVVVCSGVIPEKVLSM
jgi:hypothetical protein